MKECRKCKIPKTTTEFSSCKGNRDGLQGWCKECKRKQGLKRNREYMKTYRNPKIWIVRKWLREKKAEIGCKCGEKDFRVLDFHHKDPKMKKFGLGDSKKFRVSLEEVIEEVKKCEVLCANCHRREHFRESRWDNYPESVSVKEETGHFQNNRVTLPHLSLI